MLTIIPFEDGFTLLVYNGQGVLVTCQDNLAEVVAKYLREE